MSKQQTNVSATENKQRLEKLFRHLLPLVDGVADKLRFVLIVGALLIVWIGTWLYVIKHFSLTATSSVVTLALLPLLILFRFWWAFEELKDLPDIASQMMGDAKDEFRQSIQDIRGGEVSKLSFLGATKGMWSVRSMLGEASELLGSYISISTLINPFMLVLGVLSLGSFIFLLLASIVLAILAV